VRQGEESSKAIRNVKSMKGTLGSVIA